MALLTIGAGDSLSSTPQDQVKDALRPVSDILSPYHTFASVVSIYIATYDLAIEGI